MSDTHHIITRLCRHIEHAEEPPTLAELAGLAGWSPSHTHRVFKRATGVTPRAYAATHRQRRFVRLLDEGHSVTDALWGAGFGSSSRLYEGAWSWLGMTPTQYREGAPSIQIWFAIGECTLGALLVAATPRGVCSILLGDTPEEVLGDLEGRFPQAELLGAEDAFEALVAHVIGLVERPRRDPTLPLDVQGTAFQRRVWDALQEIPVGETRTYSELACGIGQPGAARAVARACATNPVAVLIPCHRVVRKSGALAGYRWGVERKRTLLSREVEDG